MLHVVKNSQYMKKTTIFYAGVVMDLSWFLLNIESSKVMEANQIQILMVSNLFMLRVMKQRMMYLMIQHMLQ